jgi:hypothetical protein
MRLSNSMGVEAAALTHPSLTQDSTQNVHNSRRCNQQSDPESNFGQVKTHKATTNNREKYSVQEQTNKVTPEALDFFPNRPVTMWNYYVKCQVQEHTKEIRPEAMPNCLSIKIHLTLPPSSKETNPRFSSVAADIIK